MSGLAGTATKTTHFFFNDTATTEIYTLSLHDALPISFPHSPKHVALYQKFGFWPQALTAVMSKPVEPRDRKSTRLNSSHGYISYAVFCLKKKKKQVSQTRLQ